MANKMINFIKKTYKIWVVIISLLIFFLGYNIYLVDYSLSNLRAALDNLIKAKTLWDAGKIADALDFSLLAEVASYEPSTSNILKLEFVKDILSDLRFIAQVEEVKFALAEVIKQKEKKRPIVLLALDKINKVNVAALNQISKVKLKNQVKYLRLKLTVVKDKNILQGIYYTLANTYTGLAQFQEAKIAYQKAIELNPESNLGRKAQLNLAWNEKYLGNLDEAIKEFEAISQTVTEKELIIFSKYQVANILNIKKEYEKAVAIYQQIAKEYPQSEIVRLAELKTSYICLYDLKDYEKAKEVLEEAKITSKDSSLVKYIEKKALPNIGKRYRKKAFKVLKEAHSLSSPGKYKEAMQDFDRVLEINPEDATAHTGRALIFFWLKDPDKALWSARKAVKLSPNDEVASVNLGYIYIQLGLAEEAIIEFKRFISVNPFSAYTCYNLGYAYAIKNRIEEAYQAFHQATQIDPKLASAFNNQGWCLWRLGRYAESIEAFERTIRIEPKSLNALFNSGLIYKTLGKYEEAKKRFQQVLEINPGHTEAQNHLTQIDKILSPKKQK